MIHHFLCGQGGWLWGQVPGSSILPGLGGDHSGSVSCQPADPCTRESTAPVEPRAPLQSTSDASRRSCLGSKSKSHSPWLPSQCVSWIPDTDGEPLTPTLHIPHFLLFFESGLHREPQHRELSVSEGSSVVKDAKGEAGTQGISLQPFTLHPTAWRGRLYNMGAVCLKTPELASF